MFEFMRDKRYMEVVEDYKKGYENTLKQHKNEVKDDRIKADSSAAYQNVKDKLRQFYNDRLAEIENEQSKIRKAYKSKRETYENANEEILKRQDFDMFMQTSSDEQLKNMLDDMEKSYSEYELNRLHVELKNRDINDTKLIAAKETMNFGKEYESDVNYNALSEQKINLNLINNKNLLYVPHGDSYKTLDLQELGRVGLSSSNLLGNTDERLKTLETGLNEMKKNINSMRSFKSQFDEVVEQDKESYLQKQAAKGINVFEYKDVDKRAIKGNEEYDVTHEFKYLKERYHDEGNELYNPSNPEYNIYSHLVYLRGKHQEKLESDDILRKSIENATEETA